MDPCHEAFTEIDFEPPNLDIEHMIYFEALVIKKATICQKEQMLRR